MPRKANYGPDYDDDYDIYNDYEYDNYYDADIKDVEKSIVKPSPVETAGSRLHAWRCSICTYDNDHNLPYCEMCGVVRDTSTTSNYKKFKEADVSQKYHEVSTMAQSIFTPVLSGACKASVLFPHLEEDSQNAQVLDASKSHQNRNVQARFTDLQRFFMAPHHSCRISIVPFEFDSPSPDDFVFSGKNASKGTTKAGSAIPTSTRASASTSGKKGAAEISNNLSPFQSTKQPISDTITNSATNNIKTEIVANNMQKLNLSIIADDQRNPMASRKIKVPSEYKPEKWMLEQEKGILKQLNLAIVGHVDSGKSTLSGRLLHLLGRVSQKEMHKYEKEAKEKGKGSFAYAWAMDESSEERERGVTMTVAVAYFDTKNYHVVLLDSPGHKDFVPNMISGATQADAAVLVIDASGGSFEAGMDGYGVGQTREHAQLIRSFGVDHIVVLVNKMDAVGYSKDRFDFIKSQLGTFLRSCHFKESCIAWVPASATENQNLVRASSDICLSSWYNGPCLLEAIDLLQPPERDISKPLRMPICDFIGSHSSGQVAVSGKLETGAIRNGSKVLVMPSGEVATVQSIERDSRTCTAARAGDNVVVTLQDVDFNNVIPGGVLCHPDFPVAVGAHLELKIYVLDINVPVVPGALVEFHSHRAKEAGRVSKILSVLDPKTKKASKKAPRFLTAKQSAVVEVVLDRSVCVEEFSNCRALGRAFLRASGNTIAVGTISRIIDLQF